MDPTREVREVLSNEASGGAVRRLQGEWRVLAGPERGLGMLERLAEDHRAGV